MLRAAHGSEGPFLASHLPDGSATPLFLLLPLPWGVPWYETFSSTLTLSNVYGALGTSSTDDEVLLQSHPIPPLPDPRSEPSSSSRPCSVVRCLLRGLPSPNSTSPKIAAAFRHPDPA
jgi:hypothetical protein